MVIAWTAKGNRISEFNLNIHGVFFHNVVHPFGSVLREGQAQDSACPEVGKWYALWITRCVFIHDRGNAGLFHFGSGAPLTIKTSSSGNLALVRRIALNLIRLNTSVKISIKTKRLLAATSDEFRTALLGLAVGGESDDEEGEG